MAGTATNYNTQTIRCGAVGQLWAHVAIPTVNTPLTLDADGTPDSVANPNAVHLGLTSAGSTVTIARPYSKLYADELPDPVCYVIGEGEARIEAALLQIEDDSVLDVILAGISTKTATASDILYEFGSTTTIEPVSVALIWPDEEDPTLFRYFQLFDAINESGLGFTVDRQGRSETTLTLSGRSLNGRTAAYNIQLT